MDRGGGGDPRYCCAVDLGRMKIVIDHIAGSRAGQRQELDAVPKLRFGRHPDNEISFDAHRDLDASSRHAELLEEADGFVLRDVGSSNGLLVDGSRVTEAPVPPGQSLEVEFGVGGPRVRLFIGDPEQIPARPSASSLAIPAFSEPKRDRRRRIALMIVTVALAIVAVTAAIVLVARAP
jgi:hypothetical protein